MKALGLKFHGLYGVGSVKLNGSLQKKEIKYPQEGKDVEAESKVKWIMKSDQLRNRLGVCDGFLHIIGDA